MNQHHRINLYWNDEGIPEQLHKALHATMETHWGETFLSFDNEIGKGLVKTIAFDWGLTFIQWDVSFFKDTHIHISFETETPIDFIYVSEGNLYFQNDHSEKSNIGTFQNSIIRYKAHSTNTYIFPKDSALKFTFIQIVPEKYLDKKHHNISYLNERLQLVFEFSAKDYHTLKGSHNLQIADLLNDINSSRTTGIIRTLQLEGHLLIILSLLLADHEKQLAGGHFNLSDDQIEKVHRASRIISDQISDKINVEDLAKQVSLSEFRLQEGFKTLYHQTVNGYSKEIKLQKAAEYLKYSDFSVSEIVYKIGFNSRSYFSQIFSKRFGMLPTDYRNKNSE
ncbi:AraC family transcriptional regulator [Subsaxibacter sp. CAU 1640]|uniref:helix-turn-helix transcriptional regulator n=1 Tax=Subsaxibacter sp. CAU 1640 TaxID=2933271 RepID=UPI002004A026|nr:AraC family transcriptional regulator [Subsaxibacter sp. CAU 1640]MCK7590622.1 AraC family transcriptional regulator [Subsaxibacter sp. CAU 1640]